MSSPAFPDLTPRWRIAARPLHLASLIGAWLLAIAIVFRVPILSGLDVGFGDRADAIIEISILEHWRNVLSGAAAWNAPLYFFPHTGTLGYNDGYLLHGLLYSSWRIGFDPFRAETLTTATLATIGFASCWCLIARVLRWDRATALLAAFLFTVSNNLYAQSSHAQIHSLALLPLLAAWVILAFRAEVAGRRARARGYAVAVAALLGIWLATAFYFAWFTLFFSLILLLCWAWQARAFNRQGLALLAAHRGTLAVAAGAFAIAIVPFLLLYLPKLQETGGQGFKLSYTVHLTDIFNVGPENLVWGWLIAALRGAWTLIGGNADTVFGGEHRSGFPLFFLALAGTAAWPILRSGEHGFARAFVLAVAISWALTLRVGPVSPWIAVHYLVPGASGVRVVLRYQLFLMLPLLLIIGMAYRQRFAGLARNAPGFAALTAAMLLAEQVSFAPVAELSRQVHFAALESVPAPPANCRSFGVVTARRHEPLYLDAQRDALYPHNVDAMYLAQRWRVPTLNGFSTFNPPDWDFAGAKTPDYETRVLRYVRAHRLYGVCMLDARAASPWRRLDQTLAE